MCPAVILAVSRILKVIGRINNLTNSINTRGAIRAMGESFGTKCTKDFFNFRVNILIQVVISKNIAKENLSAGILV